MDLVEDVRIFHAHRGELVHIEEPAVVDLFRRNAPVRETVGLVVQQPVEQVEAARIARDSVESLDAGIDEGRDPAAALGERREPPLDDLFFARTRGDRFGVSRIPRREVARRGDDALQLVGVGAPVIGVLCREPLVELDAEDRRIGVRRDRQRFVVVLHRERAVAEHERELLTFEHLAVLIAEDRNEQLVGKLRLHRVPLDVEDGRETRARAVLENIEPPRVRGLRDAHVVRHQIHAQYASSLPISGLSRVGSATS